MKMKKKDIKKELGAILKRHGMSFDRTYADNCVVNLRTLTYVLRVKKGDAAVLMMGEIFSHKYGNPTIETYCNNMDVAYYNDENFQCAISDILDYLSTIYFRKNNRN